MLSLHFTGNGRLMMTFIPSKHETQLYLFKCVLTLQKICDAHQYPSLHTSSLVGNRGALLISIIKPIISMILHIMSYLINCRNNEVRWNFMAFQLVVELNCS